MERDAHVLVQGFPPTLTINIRLNIEVVGTFSYNALLKRRSNLSDDDWMRYVLSHGRGLHSYYMTIH